MINKKSPAKPKNPNLFKLRVRGIFIGCEIVSSSIVKNRR
jgi:hypothetical protein